MLESVLKRHNESKVSEMVKNHQDKQCRHKLNHQKKEVVKMQGMDTYKEVRTIEFPGMVARVFIPELSEDERNRRMKLIHNAAASLLKESGRCEK